MLAPANTSHFSNPGTKKINKTLNQYVRVVRDELMKCVVTDAKSISLKLMCVVRALAQVSVQYCAMSFCKTGSFSFQRNFADRFRKSVIDLVKDDSEPEHGASATKNGRRCKENIGSCQ